MPKGPGAVSQLQIPASLTALVKQGQVLLEDVLRAFPNANKDPDAWELVLGALTAAGIELAEQAEADAGVDVEVDGDEGIPATVVGGIGSDPLALYLREMGRTPLLTAEQEMRYARQAARVPVRPTRAVTP